MTLKRITLYSPALGNGGGFIDAGTTADIGDDADQIDGDRAKDLIEAGKAVSETAAKADEKTALSQLDHDGDGKAGGSLPGDQSTRAMGARKAASES